MSWMLVTLLLIGGAMVSFGFYVLMCVPDETKESAFLHEVHIADIVELRAIPFKNFPRLFSDADYRALRAEPKLTRLGKGLKKDRKGLALRWLAALQLDVFALWRLRRLLFSYGVSTGLGLESAVAIEVSCILLFILSLRICVFLFGPFAFHGVALWGRRQIDVYKRSCQSALQRLPSQKWPDFSIEWHSRIAAH
jgi:hypothetical protein